jgi:folate-binding protein YgfZ
MTGPTRLDRTLIRVSGPDAKAFLNNLLTQSLDHLVWPGVRYGALLTPQGKVIADMMIWAAGDDAVVLDADPSRGADLMRRLTMYKLRSQVEITDVSDKHNVLVADDVFGEAQLDPRLPDLGWRALSAIRSPDGAAAYDAKRIALGVPDLARDAGPDEVFAGEALLDELNGVDFQKGCFVGQENVSRMKRRATTRKKFCPVVFEGEAIAPMTPILAGEAEIGTVRTGTAGRAVALVRIDRALEATKAGKTLSAAGRATRLDPPHWLILPERDQA